MNKIKLRVQWSKRENDFMIHYPTKSTGSFISELIKSWKLVHPTSLIDSFLNRNTKEVSHYRGSLGRYSLLETDWIQELVDRGYDKETLKFEISIDINKLEKQFPHIYESLTAEEKIKLKLP